MRNRTTTLLVIVSLTLASVASVVFAQLPSDPPGSGVTLEELFLVVNPKSPKPGSLAVVEVRAPSLNIGSAEIEWLENGKLVDGGIGKTTHPFTSGLAGSVITFTVRVKTATGAVKEKSVTVQPASVDLVWEASSTIPPFYKGKALYPLFGKLSIIALPEILDQDGRRIPDSNLVYTWTKGNEVQGNLSGYGRNIFKLASPELRFPFTVGVTIELTDGTVVASETITVNTSEPKVLVYENNPLYGVLFNRELGENVSLAGQEVVFEVYPFFFNTNDRSRLSYVWYVNGEEAPDFKGPRITLRKVGDESGTAKVSVQIVNTNLFTENITRSISVALGK